MRKGWCTKQGGVDYQVTELLLIVTYHTRVSECIYTYTYTLVCMYVCMYVCVYVCMYVCMYP